MIPQSVIELLYLLSGILFIMGLRGMSHPETARRGMFYAEFGMLIAIIGTLMQREIIRYDWIIGGLAAGSVLGLVMGLWVPMTAMPQRTALSHAFGALAAALVGVSEYYRYGGQLGHFKLGALGFEVLLGSLTTTGSLVAFGKLQGILPGKPLIFKGQNIFNMLVLAVTLGSFVSLFFPAHAMGIFYLMVGLALVFGVLLVIPIGSADMPVVMSLLNSYAGLASAATGFALGNNVLIIAGTLDGFSGFILSVLMCKAMNRSMGNVLFGAFGSAVAESAGAAGGEMREIGLEDAAAQLAYARQVVFVPGYGMATAQAQHVIRELADTLEERGVTVKYAIHPVAGRMPGHMNVLLAEANVPYDQLCEMEAINPTMDRVDVCLVIGANDVVNPVAREDKSSPIYGMPIIDADHAKTVIVMKRSMAAGFAGIENLLFYKDNTRMLFGDAKASLNSLVAQVKAS